MNVMIGPRRSGKSRQLLLWMADAPPGTTRVVMAPTHAMANFLQVSARGMGINARDWQFMDGSRDSRMKLALFAGPVEIGVDQVDHMPTDFDKDLIHPIKFATATQE